METRTAGPEFEFLFEECLVAFEDGPKSYVELVQLLPASEQSGSFRLCCYCVSKESGSFLVEDEDSFLRAVGCGKPRVRLVLRHEKV